MKLPFMRSERPIPATVVVEPPKHGRVRRNFEALTTALVGVWRNETQASASDIARSDLTSLRNRARALARNNPLVARYLYLLSYLVIGDDGFRFSSGVTNDDTSPDFLARQLIELDWEDFRKRVSADGTDLLELQRLVVRHLGVDGEAFVLLEGDTVRVIDPARIPAQLVRTARNGLNAIHNGVEVAADGSVVAYHLSEDHLGTHTTSIPSDMMLHIFHRTEANQYRGISPLTPVMVPLELLHRFTLAELASAQLGAKSVGFFERTVPDPEALPTSATADDVGPPLHIDRDELSAWELPEGLQFKESQSAHPNPNFGSFVTEVKREIAVGLGVDPALLTGNYADINFSAGKLARTVDLAAIKCWQQLLSRKLMTPLFEHRLSVGLSTGRIALPVQKELRFRNHKFTPRTFDSVLRPMEEASAIEKELNLGLTSITRVLRNRGTNIEAVIEERVNEKQLLEQAGLLPANPITEVDLNESTS